MISCKVRDPIHCLLLAFANRVQPTPTPSSSVSSPRKTSQTFTHTTSPLLRNTAPSSPYTYKRSPSPRSLLSTRRSKPPSPRSASSSTSTRLKPTRKTPSRASTPSRPPRPFPMHLPHTSTAPCHSTKRLQPRSLTPQRRRWVLLTLDSLLSQRSRVTQQQRRARASRCLSRMCMHGRRVCRLVLV